MKKTTIGTILWVIGLALMVLTVVAINGYREILAVWVFIILLFGLGGARLRGLLKQRP